MTEGTGFRSKARTGTVSYAEQALIIKGECGGCGKGQDALRSASRPSLVESGSVVVIQNSFP